MSENESDFHEWEDELVPDWMQYWRFFTYTREGAAPLTLEGMLRYQERLRREEIPGAW